MAKILLVEDDNNLREIYQARLMAEGYEISTAQNGEEALVVAKQQKPDLIVSDVMMPRISGFEMLDILRNTAELRNTKVIMLTALGQDDDQKRADNLGADRYLVKSQVTLEDIVNAAKELLSGESPARPQPTSVPDSMAVAPAAPGIPAIAHVPDPAGPATPTADPALAPPTAAPAATPPAPADATATADPASATPTIDPVAVPADPSATPPASDSPAEPPTATPVSPVAEPMSVTPEPTTPTGPTEPATPPAPAVVDSAAQGLAAEEAALQAQIASYANTPTTDAPQTAAPAADSPAADAASNDKALADAVQQLSTPANPSDPAGAPPVDTTATPAATDDNSAPSSPAGRKIIQPVTDPAAKPDLDALLAKEEAKNPTPTPGAPQPAPGAPASSTPSGKPFDPTTSL